MIKIERYVSDSGQVMECRYFDKNGVEVFGGDVVKIGKRKETLYETVCGELGFDATNREWLASGRASKCEFGVYPLTESETNQMEVIE